MVSTRMEGKIDGVRKEIESIKEDLGTMNQDMNVVQEEVKNIGGDMCRMQRDITDLKSCRLEMKRSLKVLEVREKETIRREREGFSGI